MVGDEVLQCGSCPPTLPHPPSPGALPWQLAACPRPLHPLMSLTAWQQLPCLLLSSLLQGWQHLTHLSEVPEVGLELWGGGVCLCYLSLPPPGAPLHAGTVAAGLALPSEVQVAPRWWEVCGWAPCRGSAEQMSPSLSLRAFNSGSLAAPSTAGVGSASGRADVEEGSASGPPLVIVTLFCVVSCRNNIHPRFDDNENTEKRKAGL